MGLSVGLVLGYFSVATSGLEAIARERDTVLLQYQGTTTRAPLFDLQTFAETGEASETLQDYFQRIPLGIEETQTILSAKIYDEGIPISRDIAEFLALQLSRSIGDEFGRERLADMGRSLRASFSGDREINIIEIIENYPDSTVRVNLNRLARLQSDLTLFAERIEPVLAVVEELLPELVCDCLLEGETLARLDENPLFTAQSSQNKERDKVPLNCNDNLGLHRRAQYSRVLAQLTSVSGVPTSGLSTSEISTQASIPTARLESSIKSSAEKVSQFLSQTPSTGSNHCPE